MRFPRPSASLLCVAALAATRCGGISEPAGRVTADPPAVRLLYPQSVPVRLDWMPLRPLDRRHGRVVAFAHLVVQTQRGNRVWRTFDHSLPKPWVAGEPQSEELELYQSALAEALPPGRYVLSVGLYDESWGYRWPLSAGQEVAKREYLLATVEVGGTDPGSPSFGFSGAWLPAEKIPSSQVLARRCFTGPAALSVEGRAPGTVRLLVTVPPRGGSAQTRVTASCAPGMSETLPEGTSRWLSVEVAPGRCEIAFEPPPAGPTPSAAAPTSLDVLAWRPR
jgi:hypothetical protein